MVNVDELDKFVLKFKSLLELSSRDAKFIVNAEDGVLQLNLQVNVKLENASGSGISNQYDRGTPSRKRRRERRDKERKARAAAAVEAATKVASDVGPNPIQVAEKSDIEYEMVVNVQDEVRNFEITEAIEENFVGGLMDRNVDDVKLARSLNVHKLREEAEDNRMTCCYYKLIVKNDLASEIVESWNKPGCFDDLAFENAERDKKQVKVRCIKKVS